MAFNISCSSDVFLKKKRARYYLVGNHTCCKFYAAVGLRDELLAVVKVTKKTLRKGEGGSKSIEKTKNSYAMYK